MNLEGTWSFIVDPKSVGEAEKWHSAPTSNWDFLYVPAPWNRQNLGKYEQYVGYAWYARDFYLPDDWSNKAVWLHLHGAMYMARVWVNGSLIGEHEGGFTHFKLRADNALNFGGKNHIAVMVDNTTGPETSPQSSDEKNGMNLAVDWYHWSGIYRPIYLEANSKVYFSDVTIRTESVEEGKIHVAVDISNLTDESASGEVTYQILDNDGNPATEPLGMDFTSESKGADTLGTMLTVSNPKSWSPDSPHLYTLELKLSTHSGQNDVLNTSFGIRTIEVKGGKLLLNGKPIFLKGANMVEDFPIVGRTLPGAIMRNNYAIMKDLGVNGYRHGAYPPSIADVEMSDRVGICQFINMPCLGKRGDILGKPAVIAKAKQWLREMIKEFKNCPSVIVWDLCSEPETSTEGGVRFIRELYESAKGLDPTRPVCYINNWIMFGKAREDLGEDIAQKYADLIWAWVGSGSLDWVEELHEEYRDKPVIAEFGPGFGDLRSEEGREEKQVGYLENQWEYITSHDYIFGTTWWCLFDYRLWHGIGPEKVHPSGAFKRNREPKAVVPLMKKLFRAKPTF